MHGGGSPDGARLVVRLRTPIEEFVDYARNIAGIREPVTEPEKKKQWKKIPILQFFKNSAIRNPCVRQAGEIQIYSGNSSVHNNRVAGDVV